MGKHTENINSFTFQEVELSEFIDDPSSFADSTDEPIRVMNGDTVMFYCVPPETYEDMLKIIVGVLDLKS